MVAESRQGANPSILRLDNPVDLSSYDLDAIEALIGLFKRSYRHYAEYQGYSNNYTADDESLEGFFCWIINESPLVEKV